MTSPLVLGWEEWVSLPDLRLPAIKAKVDTGAKTSALHAHRIEPFDDHTGSFVRFAVHPAPGRDDIEITCKAPLVDRREVMSSNGEREIRYVIRTTLAVGGRTWPVEVTLTDRAGMTYRMLLGRQAIKAGVLVDPSSSFVQPRLSFRAYGKRSPQPERQRPALRLALLTRQTSSGSVRALAKAAADAGQTLDILDIAHLTLALDGSGNLLDKGTLLPRYDGAIARIGGGKGSAFAIACLRQLEHAGAVALTPADALERLRTPLAAEQTLDRGRIAVARKVISESDTAEGKSEFGARACYLVIGRRVAAVAEVFDDKLTAAPRRPLSDPEAKLARRAAQALRLGLASVEIVNHNGSPAVYAVSALPKLTRFAALTGIDTARLAIDELEARFAGGHHWES